MAGDPQQRVLIVEDDPNQRALVRAALEEVFGVSEASDGREGLRLFYRDRPDLVVLDAHMPELDGWETLRRIRALAETPVIMLTGLDSDRDIVRGLHSGADEYITKPVSPAVLVARVQALLRRASQAAPVENHRLSLDDGKLVIDRGAGRVWARGEEVQLSATEYRLLNFLAEHLDQVLSPSQILTRVWGPEYSGDTGHVKTYVRLLRAKIEAHPSQPRYVIARRGLGYLLVRSPG